MLAALPAALLARGRLSPLAPLLPGALPASPSRDERSHGCAARSGLTVGPMARGASPRTSGGEPARSAATRRLASLAQPRRTQSRLRCSLRAYRRADGSRSVASDLRG